MKLTRPSIVACAILAISALQANAQTFEHVRGGTDGDFGTFLAPTSAGGYIVVGRDRSFIWDSPYISMVDGADFLLWQGVYSTDTADLNVSDVVESPEGGVVCSMANEASPGFERALMKLKPDGTIDWKRTYPGTANFADIKLSTVPGGGYIMTGVYFAASGARQPILTYVSENGALIWQRAYTHTPLLANLNAKFEDVCAVTLNGGTELGFLVCGSIATIGAQNDQGRALVALLDGAGDPIWSYSFGYTNNLLLEATQIDQATNGDILIGGNDLGVGANGNSYLMRLTPAGALIWETGYEFFGTGGSMTELTSGDVVMCGRTLDPKIPGGQAEMVLLNTNASGAPQWARAYGGTGFTFGLDVAPVGAGFVCNGTRIFPNTSGTAEMYLVRTDADGRTGCERTEPINPVTRNPNRQEEVIRAIDLEQATTLDIEMFFTEWPIESVCDTPPCPTCACAFAAPTTSCDFSDVVAFLTFFGAQDPCADLAPPSSSWDFSDVVAFLTSFGAGCN